MYVTRTATTPQARSMSFWRRFQEQRCEEARISAVFPSLDNGNDVRRRASALSFPRSTTAPYIGCLLESARRQNTEHYIISQTHTPDAQPTRRTRARSPHAATAPQQKRPPGASPIQHRHFQYARPIRHMYLPYVPV